MLTGRYQDLYQLPQKVEIEAAIKTRLKDKEGEIERRGLLCQTEMKDLQTNESNMICGRVKPVVTSI